LLDAAGDCWARVYSDRCGDIGATILARLPSAATLPVLLAYLDNTGHFVGANCSAGFDDASLR